MKKALSGLPFVKMHGMGNDFVIFQNPPAALTASFIQKIAHRRQGVGCDQVLAITSPKRPTDPLKLEIWNQDGSMAQACGNGTRCAVWLVAQNQENETAPIFLKSAAGLLEGSLTGPFEVEVTQRFPRFDAPEVDLSPWHLPPGIVIDMGNPHLVIFVPCVDEIPLQTLGPLLENHPFFPHRTNVEFVEVASDHLKMRVWERGVGVTPSCGSGACAAASAAVKKSLFKGPLVPVYLEGGVLSITVVPGQPLRQKGPVSFSYEGVWPFLKTRGIPEIFAKKT